VALRRTIANSLIATVVAVTAILTVGLTASSTGPFSIVIRPVFVRLGVDVDIKLGPRHFHASWSALPAPTTK